MGLAPGTTMKPRELLLILGGFALWAELSAAPMEGAAEPSPLPQLGNTGGHPPAGIPPRDKCSTLPSAVKKEADMLQKDPVLGGDPVPQGQRGCREAEIPPSKAGLAGTDPLLPSGGARPVPPEKPACKARPGNQTEAGSAGKFAEKPQAGTVENLLLEKRPSLAEGDLSGGEKISPATCGLSSTAAKPSPNIGHGGQEGGTPEKKPISGREPQTGGEAASEAGQTVSCKDPALSETPAPPKPLCGEKLPSAGKVASPAASPLAQASPTSDGKLASGKKPTRCDKPTSAGKLTSGGAASSDTGHATPGKPTTTEKPAPHERPGSGQKPVAEKPEAGKEPEKEAEGDSDGGEEEEEDSDDEEDEEEEEEDEEEGNDSIFSEDNSKGLEGAFDHELDYGLDQSPFNSDEYHDWWGGGDAEEELDVKPEEDAGELSEGGGAGEEPAFDVWGDLVEKGTGTEAWSD